MSEYLKDDVQPKRITLQRVDSVDASVLDIHPGEWIQIRIQKPNTARDDLEYHIFEVTYDYDQTIHIHTTKDFPDIQVWEDEN